MTALRNLLLIASRRIRRRWRLRTKSSRLHVQDSLMVDDSAEKSQKIISGVGRQLLVLVAEYEFLIKADLEDVAREAGFEHLALSKADEAILALEEVSARFRALITDIKMPEETDGWDLARRARELQPPLPVIIDWRLRQGPGSQGRS